MKLHIGIAGPIATENIAVFLTGDTRALPAGYTGAPLTGILIGELLKHGHKISAFTTDSSLYLHSDTIKASGPNFDFYVCPARPRAWRFNGNRPGRAIDGFAFEIKQLLNAMKSAKPDIIHAHWTYEFAIAAIKVNIPLLITCHDAPAAVLRYSRSPYRAVRYLMARQVFREGQNFTAVSPYLVSALQQYSKTAIEVIPNPLADYVLKLGQPRNTPSTKRIGMICNGWDERKNPQPALQAFAKIHSIHPEAEIHLFGAGFGTGGIAQQWCQKHSLLKGIVFHGVTPHKQLIEELNHLDLLLHPSLEESFGVVIAEAMALGLPIVAGRHSGAVPWVVGIDQETNDRCCAELTDVSNPETIALAIGEAFNHYYPERSASGYARVRQMFAPDVVAEFYSRLYRKLMIANFKTNNLKQQ